MTQCKTSDCALLAIDDDVIGFQPRQGCRNVATGGATSGASSPVAEPVVEFVIPCIAPAGATEAPLPNDVVELPPALRDGYSYHPFTTGFAAAPEAGWLHPWLHSYTPPG